MAVTRRTVLKGAGVAAGAQVLSPLFGTFAWGDVDPQAATRRRLVIIDLAGGNDGLNTVVPRTGAKRAVYDQVRPTIRLASGALLPLDRGGPDDGSLGFHPNLTTLHRLYRDDRVAVVQGADYPNHSYSHFVSDDIWQGGNPVNVADAGWIGRHLDRTHVALGELRAVGIGGPLARALRGRNFSGAQVNSLAETHFADGTTALANARHAAYGKFDRHTGAEPLRQEYGLMCTATVGLDEATRGLTAAAPGGLSNQLLTARTLMTANLGVEVVFILTGGYDTHANQVVQHGNLMTALDDALEAFFFGTKDGVDITVGGSAGNGIPQPVGTPPVPGTPIGPLDPAIAERTLVMTFSEFGRRIGENASGTDHGAAAPMMLIGPPAPAAGSGVPKLMPGLYGDHPDVGTTTLPADNLGMTTDLRSVYQAVLTKWINDPTGPRPDTLGDPGFVLTGTGIDPDGSLTGLFGIA